MRASQRHSAPSTEAWRLAQQARVGTHQEGPDAGQASYERLTLLVEPNDQRHVVLFAKPAVFRYKHFHLLCYSDEGNPREPLQVNVLAPSGEAKFWIRPLVRVAQSDGIDARTLRELAAVVEQNIDLLRLP